MTRSFVAVAALLTLGAAFPADAQSRPGWELSAEAFDYSYREPAEGPDVKDDGILVGAVLGYTLVRGSWIGRARLTVAAGTVDYAYGSQRLYDVHQAVGQLEFDVGRDFHFDGGYTLTPLIGVGRRGLIDESGSVVSNLGTPGYNREVIYQYVRLGAVLNTAKTRDLSFTLSGSYNRLINGSSKAFFSDVDSSIPNVKLKLGSGFGTEAAAMANFARSDGIISFGPFVRYWNIERSQPMVFEGILELSEPVNSTWQVGLRASYAF